MREKEGGAALRQPALSPSATEPVPVSAHSGDGQAQGFQREDRYIVIKRKHLTPEQERDAGALPSVSAVVVETDWPEYEAVWAMIQARVAGGQS
jgi:hypothetical protein